MKATHTYTQLMAAQKLGNHWLALDQIPLYESKYLRSTHLIDSQELIERSISKTRAPIGWFQSEANVYCKQLTLMEDVIMDKSGEIKKTLANLKS